MDQFPDLLQRLPAGLERDNLSRDTKAIQRDCKIGGGANLRCLALGWADGTCVGKPGSKGTDRRVLGVFECGRNPDRRPELQ